MHLGAAVNFALSPLELVQLVAEMDALGYEVAFVADAQVDQFAAFGACAAATERIKLATGITSVYSRTPTWLATAAATVDSLSNGRFVLGLGVGHPENWAMRDNVEPGRPLPFTNGAQRLRETTELFRLILRGAYEGHPVDYEGQIFRVRGFESRIVPVRSEIPVWFGSLGPRNLALAGEIADGAVGSVMPRPMITSYFAATVAQGAASVGRDPDDVSLVAYVPTCVSADIRSARRAVELRLVVYVARLRHYQRHLTALGFGDVVSAVLDAVPSASRAGADFGGALGIIPEDLLEMTCAWGTAEHCVATLRKFAEFNAFPVVDVTDPGFVGLMPNATAYAAFQASIAEIAQVAGLVES